MAIRVEVWGDYALFTRPEMKTERVSYDVMTPSAARGLLESIYWHPGMKWCIDRIHVCSPIRFTNIRRNEVKDTISARKVKTVMEKGQGELYLATPESIQQRAAMVLRDVHYVIGAHFDLTENAAPGDNAGKFQDIIKRRLERGQCYSMPYFGTREFPAHFRRCTELPPCPDELKGELFSGRAYDLFRQALRWTIQRRYVVLGAMVLLLVIAGWGFRFIPQQFMPLLNKQYFSVDVWLPEGTRIEESDRQMTEMTAYLNSLEGVKKVSSFVGQTPPRYCLANAAYGPQPNYAQCLVEAETPEKSRELQAMLYDRLPEMFPDALVRVNSFEINSIPQALIEARFCGDDPEVLDSLTNLALEIMRKNPKVLNARNEWGNMALMIKADYDPVKAGRLNVGRHDMMNAVKAAVPANVAVGLRVSATDWVPEGWSIEDTIHLVNLAKKEGCTFVDVSTGGNTPDAPIPVGPGYQVPFASRVKAETGMTTFAVGLIRDAWQAETLLREGAADVIDIGRAMIDDPHWGWHAANRLHVEKVPKLVVPPQYLRGLSY